MAVELVTGRQGVVHVDSADDAALYAAMAGKGEYVLQLGNQLACTMATANKAHVARGHGLMQGRHWLVDAEGVDLTIQNGTQGQKRNDLIVARYERSSDATESVVLKVLKGTPTTGTPADPAYVRGDILEGGALVNEMPLYRISLDGITVGTPVKLFEVLTPQKDAWDSVSREVAELLGDGKWHALLDGAVYYMRSASSVTVQLYNVTSYTDRDRSLGTLPAGYRPSDSVHSNAGADRAAISVMAAGSTIGYIRVNPNGEVVLLKGVSGAFSGQATFPCGTLAISIAP